MRQLLITALIGSVC